MLSQQSAREAIRRSLVVVFAAAIVVIGLLIPTPAFASLDGNDTTYVGNGTQTGKWHKSEQRVSLAVSPSSTMSSDHCMGAVTDWDTHHETHYDSRVVRSCRPGAATKSTEGGGYYWWDEPNNFEGANIYDMQHAYGYVQDDDREDNCFEIYGWDGFAGGGGTPTSWCPPRTVEDCWARTRTLYNDGHAEATPGKALLATDPQC